MLYFIIDTLVRKEVDVKAHVRLINLVITRFLGFVTTRKLLKQGFLVAKLKSSLRTFHGRHHDLVNRYGISVTQMTT
jgi:hypothetical protein